MRRAPALVAAVSIALAAPGSAIAQEGRPATVESPTPTPATAAPRVQWRAFGADAFREAAEKDQPILLYIWAQWEYHDRVMSEVSFTDPNVVEVIRSEYVPVRVDTDRRPDVFARYSMGGWPSVAILLPNAHPLYYPEKDGGSVARAGSSFLPPDVLHAYLVQLADYYAANREMVKTLSAGTDRLLLERRNAAAGEIADDHLEAVLSKVMDAYRARPVQPEPGDRHPDFDMVDLVYHYWFRKADRRILNLGLEQLTDMARGGIYDRLGGGFFRYAHDSLFIVPAFEKLPSVNAAAISAYARAYEVTGNGVFLRFVEGTVAHVRRHGIDPKTHAFTGGMAAWTRTGDNGDYYTWTLEEFKAPLTDEEFRIASLAFDVTPTGEMVDYAPRRNVIHLAQGAKLLAEGLGIEEKKVEEILESASRKLLAERDKRPAPRVDPTTYGDWSGMMASAFLWASRVLDRPEDREQALAGLEVLLVRCRDDRGLVVHACRPDSGEIGVDAFLADEVRVAAALLDAHEETGSPEYLAQARSLAERAAELFRDPISGSLSDRIPEPDAPGLMAWPVRDLRDNMAMVQVLLRLHHLTGQESYRTTARKILASWADEFGDLKEHASPYALASQMFLHPPVEILVVGDQSEPDLAAGRRQALRLFHPWRVIRHLDAARGAQVLSTRGLRPLSGAQVAFCVDKDCAGPYPAAEPLYGRFRKFLSPGPEDPARGASTPAPAPGGSGGGD